MQGHRKGEGKTREMYKLTRNVNRGWKPKLTAIKNEEGRTLVNKEDIVQRWTTYCSELYKEQLDENTAEYSRIKGYNTNG